MTKNVESRPNSSAIQGAQWGDEGKAKFADEIVEEYVSRGLICIDYSVNGGANAGHRVEINRSSGENIAINLHQLPSGVFNENVYAILGNGKVVNPQGLIYEIEKVKEISGKKQNPSIKVSSGATLALPTHQAFEFALKSKDVGKGATGQGISPAYADRVLRQQLYVKDLIEGNFDLFERHYDFYSQIINGMGVGDMSSIAVPIFSDTKGEKRPVGDKQKFLSDIKHYREIITPYVSDVYQFLKESWNNPVRYAFLFEMSQGMGLHQEYGVKPDITASDTSFVGIDAATEGIVNHLDIEHRIGISKLYCSSVGSRKLPTQMPDELAGWYRDNFHEFGGTTGRPRDIVFPDMVSTAFYAKVSHANELAISHMDATKPGDPIKICTEYRSKTTGEKIDYRPYQWWLDNVEPVYTEIPSWNGDRVSLSKSFDELPQEAKDYINLISKITNCRVTILGTGPERKQIIRI
ncbi:MAG: adenylosuccinate synthetase [Candidatus Shapirobacteria bacterium]|nr:adenylosuccinate synthetase [Candidatus Shapirobacteria bacterium]